MEAYQSFHYEDRNVTYGKVKIVGYSYGASAGRNGSGIEGREIVSSVFKLIRRLAVIILVSFLVSAAALALYDRLVRLLGLIAW